MRCDVLIVGGGPSGLATGIAAARRGMSVQVVDGVRPPADKACGEGLLPDAVELLAKLGVDAARLESAVFRGIRFVAPEATVQASFGEAEGRGVRRLELHGALRERAEALGVGLRWGTVLRALDGTTATLSTGERINAGWVIGADGQRSAVRRWAGLERVRVRSSRVGMRQHFRVAPWTDFVEVYWAAGAQAYVTPVSADEVGVAVVSRERMGSMEAALERVAPLRERLAGARATNRVRGALTVDARVERVCKGRVALVGDASGSVDAITGSGLGLGFRQAVEVAEAMARGSLDQYGAAHARIGRVAHLMSQGMLLMDSYGGVRRGLLRLFEREPELFGAMLRMHLSESVREWPAEIVGLGTRLLLA